MSKLAKVAQEAVLLVVALKVLEQIATTPRNRGARRSARAALAFIETQRAAAKETP